jgi:hypothetical protein
MPRPFFPATAEQVVGAVEAVVVGRQPTKPDFVADFSDLPLNQAESALLLASDLGLLSQKTAGFSVASPLCRFLVTSNLAQRAAVLRVVLESYLPFVVFRERLVATGAAGTAANQTRIALELDGHREAVKDTLISLGTYSDALLTEGGGRWAPQPAATDNPLQVLALASGDQASAEARIRLQLGPAACGLVSRDEVIVPLANALLRANGGDPRGAIVEAGNGVESYLSALAGRVGNTVNLANAHGINAKLDRFDQATWMSKKLIFVGKHLGHVRNAADHGVDADVGVAWTIRAATGLEYVFNACSFVAAVTAREQNAPAEI